MTGATADDDDDGASAAATRTGYVLSVLGAATSVDAPLSKLGLLSPPAIDMPSSWKYKPLPAVLVCRTARQDESTFAWHAAIYCTGGGPDADL